MFKIKIHKVRGQSMSPNFLENAFVFSIKYPLQTLQKNDVILVNHPTFGKIIKRISAISEQGIWLKGDNPISTRTEEMGLIAKNQVIGKVIFQVKAKN